MHAGVDVVVLAGGRISGPYARAAGTTIKALVQVRGLPVIRHVVEVLCATPGIGPICVVGPEAVRDVLDHRCRWQRETDSALGNLRAGIERLNPEVKDRVLLCGSDLPALDSLSLQDFLDRAPLAADVCMPVVRKAAYLATFPNSPGAYVHLAEGAFTSGSQFLIRPHALLDHSPLLEQLFNRRKTQFGMAQVLGAGLVWKFLLRRLTVAEIEARAAELTGCCCRAVPDCHAELAYDIDDLPDLRYFGSWLAR